MASPAREEKQKQAFEGLGAGGKFRKTPFRRTTQATPYDRPPTTLRNPSAANDGWLSKLVDPAHRLISNSAHRLFSSVFRKRLPPPLSPSTGVNHEANMKEKEEVTMDLSGVLRGRIDQCSDPSHPSTTDDGGKLTDLEQILEQKTFTRSEIDRLTELLHSRTVDMPIENLEIRSEGIPSKSAAPHDRKEEFPKTPLLDKNGIDSRLASNPVVSTSVLDEDVASPAELAKAYMGSRPSKVSPSMLGLCSQTHHEDSPILSSVPFPSKSPMMSLVPRNSGSEWAPQNGFVTPRSRGRSAIYSMARTPYSRVHTTSTFKGAGSTFNAYGGASSSQSVWEHSQPSGSKQGALKRRFSVLDSDIGSVGPIRRIRQKPNLLSSKGLSSPVSSTTILGATISSESAQNLWKPLSLGEPKHKALSENGDNAGPSTSFSTVPSKSSEMASKILEQLDKLVSPKEKSSESILHIVRDKSPTKLSPSMLHGQALKSLDHVDSSKFLDNALNNDNNNNNCNSKLDVSAYHVIPDARDFTSQKKDKVRENGPLTIGALSDSSTILNGADSATEKKDILQNVKTTVSAASNSVHPPQKKRAFKMSAHEDFLDLDDDDDYNGVVSDSRGKAEATSTKNTPVYSDVKTSASPFVSSSSLPNVAATQPSFTYDIVDLPKESHAGLPTFNYGGNVTSVKGSDAATSLFEFVGSKSVDKVALPESAFTSSPAVGESVNVTLSHSNPETSSSVHAAESGATTVVQPQRPGEAVGKSNSNAGDSFVIPKTTVSSPSAPSTTGIVSFGTPSSNSNMNNGSRPLFTSSAPSVFSNLTSPNSSGGLTLTANTNSVIAATAVTTNSSNGFSLAQAPSFSTTPTVKFELPTASTAVTSVPLNSPLESFEGKKKETFGGNNTQDKGLGNLSSTSFAGTSAAIPGAANQFQFSLFGTGSGSASIAQASSTGTGIASVAQNSSTEPGSSASSLSHSFAGSTPFSIGSSIFGPTSTAKLPGSGTGTALGSSTSSLEPSSISSSTAPNIFAASWQPGKPPVFATAFNSTSSSSGLSYVASSVAPATNSAPIVSGGSSIAATTSTNSVPFVFGGSSTAAATTNNVPSVFGGSSSAPATTNNVPSVFGGSSSAAATTINVPSVFGGSSSAAATTINAPITFGGSTVSSTNNNSGSLFQSSNGASLTSMFSFTSTAPTSAPSQPPFGNPNPVSPFGSPGNNDQMNMEDSMAEDTNQASTPTAPGFGQHFQFGQQPILNSQSASVFGGTSTAPAASPFQFAGQQNQTNPQNPNPFQASGSLGANQGLGGSFSVGSSGGDGDKSHRRIIKVKHNRPRKK
ncbi:nuclear pore complex protein NUP1-like [Pyrus x bretschneideri]|uniref:nuclear pore complex protein NUP1-like n=1 Tax=Pyrus x bretschneideri TaxID=225117 RepID=UPI00202DC195|nr:nuclear pore complex protein NUP1-like [Pyrus x bretschneideri]